jgi:hypothetical protein
MSMLEKFGGWEGGKPMQPEDCGVMTDREIEERRMAIVESKEFAYYFDDELTDSLTQAAAGIIGYYLYHKDYEGIARFMMENYRPGVMKTIRYLEDK